MSRIVLLEADVIRVRTSHAAAGFINNPMAFSDDAMWRLLAEKEERRDRLLGAVLDCWAAVSTKMRDPACDVSRLVSWADPLAQLIEHVLRFHRVLDDEGWPLRARARPDCTTEVEKTGITHLHEGPPPWLHSRQLWQLLQTITEENKLYLSAALNGWLRMACRVLDKDKTHVRLISGGYSLAASVEAVLREAGKLTEWGWPTQHADVMAVELARSSR